MKLKNSISVKDLLYSIKFKGNVIGDSGTLIVGLNDDFSVCPNDLTWATSSAILLSLIKKGFPLTVITNHTNIPKTDSIVLIYTQDPIAVFEQCAMHLNVLPDMPPIIGENTFVHDSAIIGNNVRIGRGCIIGPNVVIYSNTIIGDNVSIASNSTISAPPFYSQRNNDFSFIHRQIYGNVCIGDNVQIGSSCVIDKGIVGTTSIGKGTRLGNLVEIGHDVIIGNYCSLAAQVAIAGYVEIGDFCDFWGRAGVVNRIRIAPHTTVYATSVVTKNTQPGDDLCGFPAIDRKQYWKQIAELRSISKHQL